MLGKIWTKIKTGLAKTRGLFIGMADLFRWKGRVDQKFLQELEQRLYLADVGTVATTEIVAEVRQSFQDKEISGDVKTFVMDKLKALLTAPSEGIAFVSGPTVVMVAGMVRLFARCVSVQRADRP